MDENFQPTVGNLQEPSQTQPQSEAGQPPPPAMLEPAGFWIRGGALFIDIMVVTLLNGGIGYMLRGLGLKLSNFDYQFLQFLIATAYYTTTVGSCGQTVGKMAAGVIILEKTGGKVSYGRALGRSLAVILSMLTFAVGYVMAAFTNHKKTLHDYVAGTRVVFKGKVGDGRRASMALLGVLLILGPFIFATLLIKSPKISKMMQQPGETESIYERMENLKHLSAEAKTKSNLVTLRSAISIYYADAESRFPSSLDELVPKYTIAIPELDLTDHPGVRGVEYYGSEACIRISDYSGKIDGNGLKDTGKWGYVNDEKSPCWGTVFVDCIHTDSKDAAWCDF